MTDYLKPYVEETNKGKRLWYDYEAEGTYPFVVICKTTPKNPNYPIGHEHEDVMYALCKDDVIDILEYWNSETLYWVYTLKE